jgi:hypothetical protein
MWLRERTKVIMVNLVPRRRTTAVLYHGLMVDECFGRSTYSKNVPAQFLDLLSLNLTKE